MEMEKDSSCTNEMSNTTSHLSDTSFQTIFACTLGLMGISGFFLNLIVLVGVVGNAKLGTSINKLLAWICSTAMLEAVFGILTKALIIGKISFESLICIFIYHQISKIKPF